MPKPWCLGVNFDIQNFVKEREKFMQESASRTISQICFLASGILNNALHLYAGFEAMDKVLKYHMSHIENCERCQEFLDSDQPKTCLITNLPSIRSQAEKTTPHLRPCSRLDWDSAIK